MRERYSTTEPAQRDNFQRLTYSNAMRKIVFYYLLAPLSPFVPTHDPTDSFVSPSV